MKETLSRVKKSRKCRRCGGLAPHNVDEGVYKCSSCGYEEMDRLRRHEFFESNKKEIVQDILTIGSTKAREKWGILLTTFHHLANRWGLHQAYSSLGRPPPSTNGLPRLPAWRVDWSPEFKMLWLETYYTVVKSREGATKE